jgi:glycosyltransferase involved in cell wall biosynthesis
VPSVVESCEVREAWRRGIWKSYRIDRWVNRLVDANIAVSESLRRYLREDKRFPAEKVVVIRNGRELSRVVSDSGRDLNDLRSEFRVQPDELIVTLPGRLEVQKGHAYLLEALPEVLAHFHSLRVLLVGDGSLRDELAGEINRCGLGDHVALTGYRRDVYDILRISDLVVLPSLWEGLPLTAIEAGALGKPILATSVDGTPEVVLHGETGWLVPAANSAELAKAMCHLLGDPDLRRRLGERAREYVVQHYSFSRVVAETEQLYLRLCGHLAA